MLRIVNVHLPLSDEDFRSQNPGLIARRENELFTIVCDSGSRGVKEITLQERQLAVDHDGATALEEEEEAIDAIGGICIPS
jgi:hypothetical protein